MTKRKEWEPLLKRANMLRAFAKRAREQGRAVDALAYDNQANECVRAMRTMFKPEGRISFIDEKDLADCGPHGSAGAKDMSDDEGSK